MKLLRCCLFGLVGQFVWLNPVLADEPVSAYQQAVNAYVEAAGKELQALKMQVVDTLKEADEATKSAYQEFFRHLEKFETAYEELKTAGPKDFDRCKALYEEHRRATLKALAGVKVG